MKKRVGTSSSISNAEPIGRKNEVKEASPVSTRRRENRSKLLRYTDCRDLAESPRVFRYRERNPRDREAPLSSSSSSSPLRPPPPPLPWISFEPSLPSSARRSSFAASRDETREGAEANERRSAKLRRRRNDKPPGNAI